MYVYIGFNFRGICFWLNLLKLGKKVGKYNDFKLIFYFFFYFFGLGWWVGCKGVFGWMGFEFLFFWLFWFYGSIWFFCVCEVCFGCGVCGL